MATVHPKKNPLQELSAGEIMQPSVITVGRQTPLREVERVLVDQRISGCPVTDERGNIVGVVSMRDLVERYVEGDGRGGPRGFYDAPSWDADDEYGAQAVPDAAEDVAADVMNAEIYAVERSAMVPEVARLMLTKSVHRVLVKDRGRHVGLISSTDVIRAVAAL